MVPRLLRALGLPSEQATFDFDSCVVMSAEDCQTIAISCLYIEQQVQVDKPDVLVVEMTAYDVVLSSNPGILKSTGLDASC
jgi:hypothetical protein